MAYFAQFFQLSTGYVEGSIPPRFEKSAQKLIEACGDRSVLRLDGRDGLFTQHRHALEFGRKHGWAAYKICKGTSRSFARNDLEASTDFYPVTPARA